MMKIRNKHSVSTAYTHEKQFQVIHYTVQPNF